MQTGAFTMAEGNVKLNKDGTVDVVKSNLEYYLAYTPKSDATASAFAAAYAQSTQQMQIQSQLIQTLITAILSKLGGGVVEVPAVQPQSELRPLRPILRGDQ